MNKKSLGITASMLAAAFLVTGCVGDNGDYRDPHPDAWERAAARKPGYNNNNHGKDRGKDHDKGKGKN